MVVAIAVLCVLVSECVSDCVSDCVCGIRILSHSIGISNHKNKLKYSQRTGWDLIKEEVRLIERL